MVLLQMESQTECYLLRAKQNSLWLPQERREISVLFCHLHLMKYQLYRPWLPQVPVLIWGGLQLTTTIKLKRADQKFKTVAFKSQNLGKKVDSVSFSVRYSHCHDPLMTKAKKLSLFERFQIELSCISKTTRNRLFPLRLDIVRQWSWRIRLAVPQDMWRSSTQIKAITGADCSPITIRLHLSLRVHDNLYQDWDRIKFMSTG